jgi:hypothetical protein
MDAKQRNWLTLLLFFNVPGLGVVDDRGGFKTSA